MLPLHLQGWKSPSSGVASQRQIRQVSSSAEEGDGGGSANWDFVVKELEAVSEERGPVFPSAVEPPASGLSDLVLSEFGGSFLSAGVLKLAT